MTELTLWNGLYVVATTLAMILVATTIVDKIQHWRRSHPRKRGNQD